MIAVDTQLLVFTHREDSPFHVRACACIETLRHASTDWAIPWPCIHEFIAIVTHPKIYVPPSPIQKAFHYIEILLAGGNVQLLSEGSIHLRELKRIAIEGKVASPRINDARIAALCIQHGVHELWTADRDFSAFPQLVTRNPLV